MEKRKPPYRISHHRTFASAAYANEDKTYAVRRFGRRFCLTKGALIYHFAVCAQKIRKAHLGVSPILVRRYADFAVPIRSLNRRRG